MLMADFGKKNTSEFSQASLFLTFILGSLVWDIYMFDLLKISSSY